MRNRSIVPIALITAVVGTLAFAAPASAATEAETPITVAVAIGEIGITAAAGAPIEPLTASLSAQDVDFVLGTVEVIDDRASLDAAWSVTVDVDDFTFPGALGIDLSADNTAYTSAEIFTTDGYTVVATDLTDLGAVATVRTGTGAGINQSSWTPTITVVLPANATAGSYSSSVTHSLI